jgi:hypothetical protein
MFLPCSYRILKLEDSVLMSSASVTPAQQGWLISLLTVWSALLFGGFLLGKPTLPGERRMPCWTRIGSSAVLVLASLSWLHVAAGTGAATLAALIALGMAFCFAGDLFMAGLLRVAQPFTGGMAAFGFGHVAYILAFTSFGATYSKGNPGSCLPVWAGWLLVGTIGWWRVVSRAPHRTRLRWAAMLYTLSLTGTAAVTTRLALNDPRFVFAAVGATLFLVSDTILAANLFGKRQLRSMHDVVWLTYGPAQMLIVYSVGAAMRAGS